MGGGQSQPEDLKDETGQLSGDKQEKTEDVCCTICAYDYDDEKLKPVVLRCGHSFCMKCVEEISNSSKTCPFCGKHDDDFQYSINYSLLSVIETLKKVSSAATVKKSAVENLKNRIHSCKVSIQDNLKNDEKTVTLLEGYMKDLKEKEKANLVETLDIKDIQKNIAQIEYSIKNILPKPTFSVKDYTDSNLFLYEIYKQVIEEKQVFVAHSIENCVKFGKVTVFDNLLFIHSLRSISLNNNDDVVVLKFQELKRCLHSHNKFKIFLQIKCNEINLRQVVIIEPQKNSLMPQFANLCTGELGPSYLDSEFVKGNNLEEDVHSVVEVTNYMFNSEKEKGQIEYGISDFRKQQLTEFPCNTIVVQGKTNGGFQMFKSTRNTYFTDIVGVVQIPKDLDKVIDYDQLKSSVITDCGILFHMKK